jgi:hypothetical protein
MNLKGRIAFFLGFFIGNKLTIHIKTMNFFSPPNFVNIISNCTEKYFNLWTSWKLLLINWFIGGNPGGYPLE